MYVQARCLLEFSKPREAFELFNEIRILAEQWKQWSWYFLVDGFFARELALKGQFAEALDKIKDERKRASELDSAETLASIIDLAEIFIRYQLKDSSRLAALVERAPKSRFIQQVQLGIEEQLDKKSYQNKLQNLPNKTAREQIWKYLADTHAVIEQENQAMKVMVKALEIGARVGAKETFLRQEPRMGNLIIKIAGQNPTVYLEDLATAVTERIRENQEQNQDWNSSLTKRELEVLRHLSTDRPISAIAATLHISQNTMKTHLKNMYRKMDVDGRVSAVEKARANFIL
jgi:DNA-binding CsgD family transcriptional regulator